MSLQRIAIALNVVVIIGLIAIVLRDGKLSFSDGLYVVMVLCSLVALIADYVDMRNKARPPQNGN